MNLWERSRSPFIINAAIDLNSQAFNEIMEISSSLNGRRQNQEIRK